MEATLEKFTQSKSPQKSLLAEVEHLLKKEKMSANEIELTLNSKYDFATAKIVKKYKNWKKF